MAAALAGHHELIILDVMLPGGSGFELLKALRHESAVPVLLLTARGEAVDRILGLEIGADDYLAKPFDPRELVARIRAVLRRTREAASGASAHRSRRSPAASAISSCRSAPAPSPAPAQPVDLTSVEFNVLELLLRNAGSVVTREQIAEVALGRPLNSFDRSVDVHVSRLRKKLGGFPGTDDLIRPIRGIGYFFSAAATPEKSQGMNRRLFWKIFLPFWVAQALLLGVLYMRLHYRLHAENPWWVQPERRLVPTLADLAAQRYEEAGQPALARPCSTSRPCRIAPNYWLLDSDGPRVERPPAARRDHRLRPARVAA